MISRGNNRFEIADYVDGVSYSKWSEMKHVLK